MTEYRSEDNRRPGNMADDGYILPALAGFAIQLQFLPANKDNELLTIILAAVAGSRF